ncbi:CoA transferase [Bradyrhizobium tropiciagri]|uniref:CaiB/BaiF CoA transferase family protein n=1 Tax=Bradyrhizobium tropiciagri TaxID=312253 RepID=UPI001BAB9C13|nr:CaiB/BaiF CoA-transferase family protein [Bradyrhizobium tropiciagri]MBR0898959.1 CoA transferase [Bradyrhizobium tropiciagri]
MGPLAGLRVIEMAGIGPAPMCAMLLADMGATVLRIDRRGPSDLGIPGELKYAVHNRSRNAVAVDLKKGEGIELVLELVGKADALIEGFRPGVMERLGLGPEVCLARNPRLVFGRMTGWGQDGPMAHAAGHDLNYISLSGAAAAVGRAGGPPVPPLNLVGDYGGGSLYLALGVLAAIFEVHKSGKGQIIDAAMVDGAASLMSAFYGMYAANTWTLERGTNILDSGAFFYDLYECADGNYISLGFIEDKFLEQGLKLLGIDQSEMPPKMDRVRWPEAKVKIAARVKTKTRDEWRAIMEGTDACFAPVLNLAEAPKHSHNVARKTFVEVDGVVQPAPAPRFSRTPNATPTAPREPSAESLLDWGVASTRIASLRKLGVLG